jgi:uncharacterized protein (DUF2236 family)
MMRGMELADGRRSKSAFIAALDVEALLQVEEDAARFERCIAEARLRAPSEEEGFFGPDSMLWRVFGELAVNLGGFRAVAMQIALPEVAASGIHNQRFREGFLLRSLRSFGTVSDMAFGSVGVAVRAARQLHALHAMVRGTLPAEASERRAGERYRANDTASLLWVLATLYESSVFAHGCFVGPLDAAERARYWDDFRLLGLIHGIPLSDIPETVAGFERYWERMQAEGGVEAGPAARALMREVAQSTPGRTLLGRLDSPLSWLDDAWLAGTLPPEWAERLEIRSTRAQKRVFIAACAASRAALRVTPLPLRRSPAFHQGVVRIANARGERPPRAARLVDRVNARVPLPFSLRSVRVPESETRDVVSELFG